MRLLGPPVLESDTGAWPFPCERPYQLLAYLAACGDWVDRDRLAALFWPEQGNAEARRNLRRILHAAAHVGAPVALERRGDLLRWQVPTDLALFEAALREGRHPDALALVRGPFADGMDTPACEGFDRWLAAERQRFGSRVQAARAMLPAAHEPRSAAGALQPDREPGHERELEALSAWWAAGAGCAGVVGPAGVGRRGWPASWPRASGVPRPGSPGGRGAARGAHRAGIAGDAARHGGVARAAARRAGRCRARP